MRLASVSAVAALAVTGAACSSSPPTHSQTGATTPTTSTVPTIGAASPVDAAKDFVQAVMTTPDRAQACQFVDPSQIAPCQGAVAAIHVTADSYSIGHTATDGSKALVVILAKNLCIQAVILQGKSCHSNADPNKGLPATEAGFAAAYRESLASSKTGLSTIPCVLIRGKWYVEL
jgi:hypothetical protein